MSSDRIMGLRQALSLTPDNHRLHLLLAEELERSGHNSEAISEYIQLFEGGNLPSADITRVGVLAANNGHREFAVRCLNAAVEEDLPVSSLLSVLNQSQEGSGAVNPTFDIGNIGSIETAQALPTAEAQVTFKDVGGLESVKQIINRMIILPFQRPELYAKYGRISGWGRDALRPSWMRQNTAFKGNRR